MQAVYPAGTAGASGTSARVPPAITGCPRCPSSRRRVKGAPESQPAPGSRVPTEPALGARSTPPREFCRQSKILQWCDPAHAGRAQFVWSRIGGCLLKAGCRPWTELAAPPWRSPVSASELTIAGEGSACGPARASPRMASILRHQAGVRGQLQLPLGRTWSAGRGVGPVGCGGGSARRRLAMRPASEGRA
jgi:hypothetical protein